MRWAFGEHVAGRLGVPSPNSGSLVSCSVAVPSYASCSDFEGLEFGKEGRKKERKGGREKEREGKREEGRKEGIWMHLQTV